MKHLLFLVIFFPSLVSANDFLDSIKSSLGMNNSKCFIAMDKGGNYSYSFENYTSTSEETILKKCNELPNAGFCHIINDENSDIEEENECKSFSEKLSKSKGQRFCVVTRYYDKKTYDDDKKIKGFTWFYASNESRAIQQSFNNCEREHGKGYCEIKNRLWFHPENEPDKCKETMDAMLNKVIVANKNLADKNKREQIALDNYIAQKAIEDEEERKYGFKGNFCASSIDSEGNYYTVIDINSHLSKKAALKQCNDEGNRCELLLSPREVSSSNECNKLVDKKYQRLDFYCAIARGNKRGRTTVANVIHYNRAIAREMAVEHCDEEANDCSIVKTISVSGKSNKRIKACNKKAKKML